LLVDPQSQANKWIKNMERENNLVVTKLSNPKFLKMIEVCLPAGNPVLMENIEESLDPSLEPLLVNDVRKQNGQDCIKLGDSWIAIAKEFKFYMTTKLANPHYLPEVCIKVTLVNFTVTPDGLED
jgi:dynein heavy chain, axonemal